MLLTLYFLIILESFPKDQYIVVVESASNASPNPFDRFRGIGCLERKVELPDVYFSRGFGSQAKLGVLPKTTGLPSFIGNLVRGSTYTIDCNAKVASNQGHLALNRTGVL